MENKNEIRSYIDVCIPDIGGAANIDVIDIMVKVGDHITKDQSLITLESDKATMDIPSPAEGVVEQIILALGDKVSQGMPLLKLKVIENTENTAQILIPDEPSKITPVVPPLTPVVADTSAHTLSSTDIIAQSAQIISAGPSARRLARELGVTLAEVAGSGRKARINKADIAHHVKNKINTCDFKQNLAIATTSNIDFSKFGAINIQALNKIKRLTGANLHRSWISIPHVTQFDEADISELEAFRQAEKTKAPAYNLTILAFVCKIVAKALLTYPQFNSSLDASGENLIYKHYYNIGIAVETPNGLVVPVIHRVDQLSVSEIAIKMSELSTKARARGLTPADMSGGCFTISSLGGIGGSAFTPIINAPEVAILGLSRATIKAVHSNGEFIPRLMLPLSMSYDHRVIDGAEAARFTSFISAQLNDIRRILL